MSLAGCLGSDEEGDDEGEQSEPTEAEDAEDEDGAESDQTDVEADTEDGENVTDEAQEIRPSDLDLEPSDAWDDDHPDVEVPDEPGRAVLVVGGRRVEMIGEMDGGPNQRHFETATDDDEFSGGGSYFFAKGLFEPTDEALEEHGWEGGHQVEFWRRMVGWSGNSLVYRNSDMLHIGWPNTFESATYTYFEDVDGSAVDYPSLDDDFVSTTAEEPFLRVDRTGVITATGTVEDPGDSDVPEGTTFEFGARAQEGWAEQWVED